MVGRNFSTSSPIAAAHRPQTRSAAAIEFRIVPSMSNRKAAYRFSGRMIFASGKEDKEISFARTG
jgi:hypothetical protein